MARDLYTPYQIAEDGGVIDPPIIPDYERKITDACALADDSMIQVLTDEYHDARQKIAARHNQRVTQRQQEDERLFAIERRRQMEDAAKANTAAQEQARIQEANRLRTIHGSPTIDPHGAGLQGSTLDQPTLPAAGPEQGAVSPDQYTGPQPPAPTLPSEAPVSDPSFVPPVRGDDQTGG